MSRQHLTEEPEVAMEEHVRKRTFQADAAAGGKALGGRGSDMYEEQHGAMRLGWKEGQNLEFLLVFYLYRMH